MSAELESAISSSHEVQKAESLLDKLNKDLAWELSKTAVDVAGIADPTPISDVIGAGMSIASGDWIGAGLSLISIVPYAGDALGKTAKGARAAKKIATLKKKIVGAIATVNKARKLAKTSKTFMAATRKKVAAAIRRARKKAHKAKEAVKKKLKKPCSKKNKFGTRSPADGNGGKWSGERGNSTWVTDSGKKVEFKDGYPDFSPHAKHKVEIDMRGTRADFDAANNAMKKTDPNWEQPEGWTWHHKEDGVTMELVPSEINNKIPHDGGVSIVKSPEY